MPEVPTGPGDDTDVRRTRTPTGSPVTAVAAAVKLTFLTLLPTPGAMTMFVAICSPASVSTPLLLKSTQALRKAEEPVVLVTVTGTTAGPPAVIEGMPTPSSSARPLVSSPVAVAFSVALYSTSTSAPMRSALLAVLAAKANCE